MLKRFVLKDVALRLSLIAVCATLLSSAGFAQAQVEEVVTKRAHLRQSGALITAQSRPITLKKGVSGILFKGIASSAPESSIRINVGESVRVLSYKWVTDSNLIQDEDLRRINAEIAVQKDSLRSANRAERRLLYAKGVLDANRQIDVSDKSIYIDDLDELVTYYKSALRAWDNEFMQLKHHKKALNHQIDSLETAKSSLMTTLESINTALYVQLSAQTEVKRTLDFTYEIETAHWEPDYFISLNGDGEASLAMSARVHQSTGFDWNDIALSFEFGEDSEGADGATYSANFMKASQVTNVPQHVETYIFDLKKLNCTYQMASIANPNTSAHPYNSVLLSNLSGFSLPKGKVTLKTVSGFQKTDTLSSSIDQDSNWFSLGLDNGVLCTKSISKEKLSKSIVGSKQTLSLEWEAVLVNNSSRTQNITYTDYLPIAGEGVLIENDLPKGSQSSTSQFSYNVVLEPGASETISYKFRIEAPKGTNINNYYTK